MNEVRFQIGIPRAGSAARIAEQDSTSTNSGRITRPEAGSAAREAEAEKAAAGLTSKTVAGFSLRGQNGAVTRNTSVTQSASNRVGVFAAPSEVVAQPVATPQAAVESPSSDDRGGNPEQAFAGPLHLAASRFQTLVRSLFSSSDTAGKS